MAWNKIHSFCLDPAEKFCFAGDGSGQIHALRTADLSAIQTLRAHTGEINAMARHPIYPMIASFSVDHLVRVWSYDTEGKLSLKSTIPLRGRQPRNSESKLHVVSSTSQALAFHDTRPQLVCRTASSAVMEVDVSPENSFNILRCFVVDEKWDMATIRYRSESDDLLIGTVRGGVYLVSDGEIKRQWQFEEETVHWFEPLPDDTYLLASDSRSVIHLDPEKESPIAIGPKFARDDFEHIHRSKETGRIFAASFDRNIYEINPKTLSSKRIVFKAPFKNRWIKTLAKSPDILLVQCRNGAIYKVDLNTGSILHSYQKSPPTLWSAVKRSDQKLIMAGDGESFYEGNSRDATDTFHQRSSLCWSKKNLEKVDSSYTKRVAAHPTLPWVAFARTSGELILRDTQSEITRRNLGSAIRDCQFSPDGNTLFACTEAGELVALRTEDLAILQKFETTQPLWSLAISSNGKWIATGERIGILFILETTDFSKKIEIPNGTRLPKRMKWHSDTKLLLTHSNEVHEFDLETSSIKPAFLKMRNTVEDFFWTEDRRYLVAQTYNRLLFLFDFNSFEMLWVTSDQMDYTKGLLLLESTVYPYEFISFGRTGTPMLFQIFEERILALGRSSTSSDQVL